MPLRARIGRAGAFATLALIGMQAEAVVLTACCFTGKRTLTLTVGTAVAGSIDTVQFNVGMSGTGNSLPAAPNPQGNSVAVAASSGTVLIQTLAQVPASRVPQQVTTTVTSPSGLSCLSGPCGTASIPFTSISWTATSSANPGDFQSTGVFGNGTTQTIQSGTFNGFVIGGKTQGGTYSVGSTFSFSYANTSQYLAGTYRGTVVYTASLP